MKNPYNTARPSASRRGFALIITVVLVAFLVLILVGLATFTRVETQVADNSQQLAKARQNALLALNIAVGQLQKTTGPDQRVTATADLQPRTAENSVNDGASGENLSGSASGSGNPLDKIDTYWNASRNRHWVGAWKNDNATVYNADTPAAFNPEPELEAWLVSGNETVADQFKPTDAVSGLTYAAVNATGAASTAITGAGGSYRLLVGKTTAGIAAAADIGRAVVAPQVEIKSDSVPGLPGDQTVGHYAWWVGDEGVKAKANVIDAYSSGPNAEENRTRLQSAQRPVIEAINSDLENIYKANDTVLNKLMSFDQLGFTSTTASDLNDFYRPRFHDITLHSQGVLADTKRGGLKGDFSKILGQSNDTTARDDLRTVIGNNALSLTDNILTPETTVYATPISGFTGNYQQGLSLTPTWSQLRSFFNMGKQTPDGVMTNASSTVAQARLQTQTVQGISPRIVQFKLFFGLAVDGSTKAVSLQMRPLVVLANPYNVDITGTWWLRIEDNAFQMNLRMGDFPTASPPSDADLSNVLTTFPDTQKIYDNNDLSKNYHDRLKLKFSNVTIPAGEARVFCLQQDSSDSGGAAQTLELADGLDETKTFTWNTGATLPAPADSTKTRYVTLHATKIKIAVRLFASDPWSGPANQPDANLAQFVAAKDTPGNGAGVLVQPITSGSGQGGGAWFVVRDALQMNFQQISPFIQANYRALYHQYAGESGNGNHALETAEGYVQKASSGADQKFVGDLLLDTSGDKVRWGPVSRGKLGGDTVKPDNVGDDTGFKNILYDLPRPEHPLVSFGQLQHFNIVGFIKNGRADGASDDPKGFGVIANTFQANYTLANSYANPWVGRNRVLTASATGGIAYDGAWLFNEALADRFFFSSYPASGGNSPGTYNRINHRLSLRDADISEADFMSGSRTAAKNLLLDGAFNINSTSVEAWKAVLSATRKVPVGGDSTVNVGFARTLYQPDKYNDARNGDSADAWAGYTSLTDAEIDKLAREIVLQIHRRGPALSLADFYNRRLVAAGDDPSAFKLGVSGAVQSAIDAVLNKQTDVDAPFDATQSTYVSFAGAVAEQQDYRMRTLIAGAPGYLLQGDVLSTLAPSLSARSDTFVIRTYGDSYNPATGETIGQAWCEAVVQRLPDYVDKTDSAETSVSALTATNEKFGRRYQVVSFRWLSPDDI